MAEHDQISEDFSPVTNSNYTTKNYTKAKFQKVGLNFLKTLFSEENAPTHQEISKTPETQKKPSEHCSLIEKKNNYHKIIKAIIMQPEDIFSIRSCGR